MKNRLAKNVGLMGISQMANYVFPLITVPYVSRVLGPGNYGLVEFASTVMIYFTALIVYGMNTTGTREVAEHSDDLGKVSSIFSSILFTRLFLLLVAAVLYIPSIYIVPRLAENQLLMWSAFPILIGWMLYPAFLFQGLQELKYVAGANFLIKLIATVSILLIIKEPEDFTQILLINSLSQIFISLVLIGIVTRLYPELKVHWPGWSNIQFWLRFSRPMFLSNFLMRLAKFSGLIIAGLFLAEVDLGYFAASLKIVVVLHSLLFIPLTTAAFPYMSQLKKKDEVRFKEVFKRVFFLSLLGTSLATATLYFFAEPILVYGLGAEYTGAVEVLKVLSAVLVLSTISHFTMNQGLLLFKKDKIFLNIILIVSLISVGLNWFLISQYQLEGASYTRLITEVLLAAIGVLSFWKVLAARKA